MKQDPELLIALAAHYRDRDDVRVLVHSGGPALEYLRARGEEQGLPNLVVRGFVPFDALPDVLGAADVMLASIHRDAGRYSVPSKVMAYLCAGRPVVLSVPHDNLAGRIVDGENAGVVVEPGDVTGFLAAADRLLGAPEERALMGGNARRYAESAFAIEPIADRFERILARAVNGSAEPVP